jgi:hypothetical protein
MIQPRYRRDYPGEFVILSTTFRGGQKIQQREWVDNPIDNQHISGRAAVIATLDHRERFDPRILERHRGGLQGKKRLQTYGTGDVWRHMRLNFYVTTNPDTLADIRGTTYGDDTVVYTTSRLVRSNPGDFFLIPYGPRLTDPAMAMYLAAFDGHREVFVLGLDADVIRSNPDWQSDIDSVISAYQDTKFVFVGVASNMPDTWRRHRNTGFLIHRDFVTTCDV